MKHDAHYLKHIIHTNQLSCPVHGKK